MTLVGEDNCPFCAKVRSGNHMGEIKGAIFFEPLGPAVPGHLLFVPKEHISPRNPLAWLDATMSVVSAVKYYRIREGDDRDFNLILNVGEDAQQTIEHMHLHYIPRVPKDGFLPTWGHNH